jgi:hypothetical protein
MALVTPNNWCRCMGRCLVISSPHHTNISFILNPLSYNITYLFWLATSYGCPSFMVLMWSYHWWFKYPFALVPLQEWTYISPWHILGYSHNYWFGEWSTSLEGGLSPFASPHPMTNEYPYHHKWLSNFDGCYHYWPNLHRYGVVNNNDNTCSDDGYLGKYTILRKSSIKQWLHSLYYWNVWVFSFLFRFIFDYLSKNHYHASSTIFFSPLDACFLLLTMRVHSLATCASHSTSLMGYCTWLGFFSFSTHHS